MKRENENNKLIMNELINTATLSCLLFLAILTLSKKSHSAIGYRFLALLFMLLAFDFANEVLIKNEVYTQYPFLVVVFQPVMVAFAPAIYLAVIYLTSITQKVSFFIIFHFIPYFLLLSLYTLMYFFRKSDKLFLSNVEPSFKGEFFELALLFFFVVQMSVYLFLSIKQLRKHRKTLSTFVSNISDNDYHWLYKMIIGLCVLSLVSFMEIAFQQNDLSFYFSFIYLIGFYYVGVQVAKQKDVFPFSKEQSESIAAIIEDLQHTSADKTLENELDSDEDTPDRKKVLSEERLSYFNTKLLELMEKEKPYLDSEITLPKLGKMLLLNTYQTSYLINASFGENFYTFINRYRIEECKKMLASNQYQHLSILSIAFEAGFNSKTAFNTSFKKSTGLSPKAFKAQMEQEIHREKSSDLSTN